MKIKLMRPQRVLVEAGETIEVSDSLAELLIHTGAAVRIENKQPKLEKAVPAEKAETASKKTSKKKD